ncbi:MAG: hypothetical protein PHQ34_13825 [Methanothrix sp.]|nr:hypothetical protein [Methanothrix sp.]
MVNQKFLTKGSGVLAEAQAIATSSGAGDAGKIPCLDENGKIAENMMPTGVSAETQVAKAGTGGLAANDVVYLHLVTTTLTADKADATDATKRAQGYVKDAVSEGDDATVFLDGELPGSGFTPGAKYYLTTTPGTVSTTPPSGSGNMVQCVGEAVSSTAIKFDPDKMPIVLV